MRQLVTLSLERIIEFVAGLGEQPASEVAGAADVARSLREALPRQGADMPELLELLFEEVFPRSYNTAGPGYLAYIPGGGLFHSAVADLIADAVNRYVGVWLAAPAAAQLETNVVRWFCEMVGYPEDSLGFLTTGGSQANLTAILVARQIKLGSVLPEATIYVSDQVHHSLTKAAVLAGFDKRCLRVVPTDRFYRMEIDSLRRQIGIDRSQGRRPFLLIVSAGTTNTGAVDDLRAAADVARAEDLWLHVDGAYGGFFVLTKMGKVLLDGLAEADSITLDPHKGLFLPYGTGSLLVRERSFLERTFRSDAAYMPRLQRNPEFVDFCEISPELSRDFRGLRIWLPLKLHGIDPFVRNLEEKRELAFWLAEQLKRLPHFEILAEPQLSTLAFRLNPGGLDDLRLDELNRRLLDETNAKKRVFLSSTSVKGIFAIRICVLSFRTHLEHVKLALGDLREVADTILRSYA